MSRFSEHKISGGKISGGKIAGGGRLTDSAIVSVESFDVARGIFFICHLREFNLHSKTLGCHLRESGQIYGGVNAHPPYLHFVVWIVDSNEVRVYHVNVAKDLSWENFVNETCEFLDRNGIYINFLVQDRQEKFLHERSILALSHLPLDFVRMITLFSVAKFDAISNITNVYNSFKVKAATERTTEWMEWVREVEGSVHYLFQRRQNMKWLDWSPMFQVSMLQKILTNLATMMSPPQYQLHETILTFLFQGMLHLNSWVNNGQISHQMESYLTDPSNLFAYVGPPGEMSENKCRLTLLRIHKEAMETNQMPKEAIMSGFEYDTVLRNRETFIQNLSHDIRCGLAYNAGTFRSKYAHTNKKVIYMQITSDPTVIDDLGDLFPDLI